MLIEIEKELYNELIQEKDRLAEENRRLNKQIYEMEYDMRDLKRHFDEMKQQQGRCYDAWLARDPKIEEE